MERITIKDLTRKLNEADHEGMETSEVLVLEDTLWGLESRVYRPLGELQLPVQYANGTFKDDEVPYISYDLFTIFNNSFFEGIIARCEGIHLPNVPMYPRTVLESIDRMFEEDKLIYIHHEGFSDKGGAKKLTQRFLADFLKKYQNLTEVKDEEARECLQRSFVKYEQGEPK